MYWNNKNVFITGANGFLGSWVAEELVERKANAILLTRDIFTKSRLYTNCITERSSVLVRGGIEDLHLLERILNEYQVDTVFHLAAQSVVTVANSNPISTFESNIRGTWNVLEACRRNKVKKVLVASSDKSYGDSLILPYTEDMPLVGRNPYDVSKSAADLISQMYFHHYKLPVCITRCSNLFGGGDLNFSRVIPGTIMKVLNNQQPVIKGIKFYRDFLYIKDAVSAYLTLAENMDREEVLGNAFNFGIGSPYNISNLIRDIISIMNSNISPIVLEDTKGEILSQYLSIEKAKKLLDWTPKYSLQEGLVETIAWYTEFKNDSM